MDELLYFWLGGLSLWVFYMFAIRCCLWVRIQEMRRCCLIWWMISSCQGSRRFIRSYLISSIYFSIAVSYSNLAASIFPPTLLLIIMFSIRYLNYVGSLEICFSFSTSFDKILFVVFSITLVSSEKCIVSDLRGNISFPIFFHNLCYPQISDNIEHKWLQIFNQIEQTWLGGWCQYVSCVEWVFINFFLFF